MNPDTKHHTPTGMDLIAAERRRQVEVEGYTFAHDLEHGERALRAAADCYVAGFPRNWPWALEYWKPKDRLSDLVRAGALHLAAAEVWNATRRPGDQVIGDPAVAACAAELDAILATAKKWLSSSFAVVAPVVVHEQEVRAGVLALAPFFPPDTALREDAIEEHEFVLASLEHIVEAVLTAARTPGVTS